MVVVYRLQGLDGEATEPMIEDGDLVEDSEDELDPEEEYKLAGEMAECSGIQVMIDRVAKINDFAVAHEEAVLLLRLLFCCVKVGGAECVFDVVGLTRERRSKLTGWR